MALAQRACVAAGRRGWRPLSTAAAASGLAPGATSCCFASDNTRGALPEVLAAVAAANGPASVPSYGADDLTAAAADAVIGFLGCHPDAAVLPAVSGIASDALGLTPYAQPCSAVYAHEISHVNLWQCGAVNFYTGAMLETIAGAHGKIDPLLLQGLLASKSASRSAAYLPSAAVVSVTQPTEAGTVYSLEELREVCRIAHSHGVSVHMDGARLANAVVALGCTAAETTWEAGVDVVCLGTTKGGTLAAEAVVFFNPAGDTDINRYYPDTSDVPLESVGGALDMVNVARRRKRAGHELSKNRFVAAQIVCYLEDDLWRRSATNGNDSATALAAALADAAPADLDWVWQHPVETNQLFMSLADDEAGNAAADRLGVAVGAVRWDSTIAGRICVRMVTAFNTTAEEIAMARESMAGDAA